MAVGWRVTWVDNLTRGALWRLDTVRDNIELCDVDVRDVALLTRASQGADVMFHLAAVNGTENFYNKPELVLDVGIRGALAAVEACQKAGVPDLVLASSAEVYQTPPSIPTDEAAPLMLPDSLNPRYSYGGSKIISELIAFNYGQDHFNKVQVFRPHNVYGPDMGHKHVVPQFIMRAFDNLKHNEAQFPIQGTGMETRAFCYVDDIVRGVMCMYENGEHRQVYHIGNDQMVSMHDLAVKIGEKIGLYLSPVPSAAPAGETSTRCPSIEKMKHIGYQPQVDLDTGLQMTISWYKANGHLGADNPIL